MQRYRIRNWSKFQHFKDRRPPWVKLYRDLLDDMEWHELDPKAAKALVMLWLIASEEEGNLPDVKKLAFRLRTTEDEMVQIVSKLSPWLEQCDIEVISTRYQDDPLETERETETEIQPPKPVASRRRPQKTSLPEDFDVSDSVKDWAAGKGYRNLDEHMDAFKRKAQMKGYQYVDWDMAFMEAVRENWAKLGNTPVGDNRPRLVL